MPLKKGQKLTDDPRIFRREIRMTKSESELLKQTAEALNTSQTAVIVRGIKAVHAEISKKKE